jgi:hypothetical protein
MEVSCRFHSPAALSPGNNPLYPLDRRICGPQSHSESCGVKSLSHAGNITLFPRFPAGDLAAVVTELSNLLCTRGIESAVAIGMVGSYRCEK